MSAPMEDVKDKDTTGTQSVAGQILQAFFDALAAKPGYEEIAERLKSEIIGKQSTSEASLRRALFGEDAG